MSHSAILISEVAYYAAVTVDVLTELDSLFRQMNHFHSSRQIEEERTIEAKADRIVQERIPKLLHQVWDELCSSIKIFIAFPSTSNGRTEECKQDLVYYSVQFALFRSVYQFTIATLSRRTQCSDESALGSRSWPRCIAQLLQEKEFSRSSSSHSSSSSYPLQQEKHHLEEWLTDFVNTLLDITEKYTTNNTVPSFSPLAESLAAAKESFQESSVRRGGQQQHSEDLCSDNMQQEQIRFFTEACLGVADDLLAFFRDTMNEKVSAVVQQKEEEKSRSDDNRSVFTPATPQSNDKTTNVVSIREAAVPEPRDEHVIECDSLSSGEERWMFFRTRPGDNPRLTLNEVVEQVRSFYETYNKKKVILAESLAEGFGEDYNDLFDALEYRYCFDAQDGSQCDVNSIVHETTKDDRNGRQPEESNPEALIGSTQPAGCAVM